MITKLIGALALSVLAAAAASAQEAARESSRATLVYDHELPTVPGKSVRGVLVEYAPGAASPAHTHASSAFIYATVLEGAVRSQVNDGPVTVFQAGESWTEFPGDRHRVSENASATEPARLLAMFVVDTAETVLTTPDQGALTTVSYENYAWVEGCE